MAWESRGRSGKRYFYRSYRRPDGSVAKEYVGRGPRAEQAAVEDDRRHHAREADRAAVGRGAARLAEAEELTARVAAAAEALTSALLVAGGWHRTNYGPWRRKR